MPSGASQKSAWRPRLPSWAPLTLGLLTACLPVAQASSRAGLGLHLGYHPGPGHQTHLNKTEEVVRHQFPWARPSVFPSVPCATAQGACGRFQVVLSWGKGLSSAYKSSHHHALHGDCTRNPPRPAPPMPRPFCCFCCCGPPRPRPLAASSRTMSMISSGMRRYLMVLPRM